MMRSMRSGAVQSVGRELREEENGGGVAECKTEAAPASRSDALKVDVGRGLASAHGHRTRMERRRVSDASRPGVGVAHPGAVIKRRSRDAE